MTWECPNCEKRYPDSAAGRPIVADADEKVSCVACRDRRPPTLEAIHEVPWSNIEGAHIRVQQEIDDRDPLDFHEDRGADLVYTEERGGELVGRAEGQGLHYDSGRGEIMPTRIGPAIFLSTPQDTVLEVRTDKLDNKLLEFEPPEDGEEIET